jgi:hypothetical protein
MCGLKVLGKEASLTNEVEQRILAKNDAVRTVRDLIGVVCDVVSAYHEHAIVLPPINEWCRFDYIRSTPFFDAGKKYVNGRPWTVLQVAQYLNRTTTAGRKRKPKPDKNITTAVNLLDLLSTNTPPEDVLQIAQLSKGAAIKLTRLLKKS